MSMPARRGASGSPATSSPAAPGPLGPRPRRKKLVTDGPFAATKEAIGGFDLLECGSLEEAAEIAASHPNARMGTIEVRPLWDD
jgi:hypothetical protein